ncbi:MAG: hypothetical protein IKJ77_01775 [Firmicutes bacterium]|nr:hypothetical protein [Bacillota bacterium]
MSEERYNDIIKEIESLPQGGITYKKINGKEYAYYQWREDGKQRSRRAKDDELETLTAQIERRKELEAVLKEAGLMAKTKTAKPRKSAEKKTAEKKPAEKKAKSAKTTKAKSAAKAASAAPVAEVEARWFDDESRKSIRHVLLPEAADDGQAEELVAFLLEDAFFGSLTASEREAMAEALTTRMKARMLEDVLHLETKTAKSGCEVFRLHLADGAFEMVVADGKAGTCELYEIKHCSELSSAHCEYLLNDEICDAVAGRYGQITGKFVLYHGKTINVMEAGDRGTMQSVKYWNAEKYLEDLKK